MKIVMYVLLALAMVCGCSDKSTDNSGTPEAPKLAGNYYGKFFVNDPPYFSYWAETIEFNFFDSTYSWTNIRHGNVSYQAGGGHFRVFGDSIWFVDEEAHLGDRIYLTLGGNYRLSQNDPLVTFYREVDDTVYQVIVLERATITN